MRFPKQLSGRRPKLPRQPWQTRAVARARSVILALGAGPSGFPKQFSGRRPKLLRQPPSRSLPSFWRWGLARPGFPKQVSERCKAGGSWTPTAMANPRRRTRALRYFGAGGWPVGLPETIFRPKLPRQPWQTRAVARARSVILALGAGPSGFPKQFSGRRPKLLRQPPSRSLPSFWRWGLARPGFPKQVSERCKAGGSWTPTAMANPRRRTRALRYFGAGGWPVGLPETIFRAKLPRQPWQTRAVARACSVILALGAGPSGFPKQVSERRKAGGSWRPPRHMRPEAYVATRAAQIIKGEDQASGRNGRFTNQKRTSGQIPYKEFISGQAEQFLGRLAKRMASLSRPASRSGRFIKADGRFMKFYQQWPLYQG